MTYVGESTGAHFDGVWHALDPKAKGQLKDLNSAYAINRHIDAVWCASLRDQINAAVVSCKRAEAGAVTTCSTSQPESGDSSYSEPEPDTLERRWTGSELSKPECRTSTV